MIHYPYGYFASVDSGMSIAPTPNQVSGLSVWYDFADTANVVIGSGGISQITDKSGNSRHATQASSGSRPDVITNQINGLQVARFNGTGDALNSADTYPGTQAFSMFILFKSTLDARNILHINTPTAEYISHGLGSSGKIGYYGANRNAAAWRNTSNSVTGNFDLLQILTDASNLSMYLNSTLTSFTYASANTYTDTYSIMVGGRNDSGQFFQGDIAEIIIYNRFLNSTERGQIQSYFTQKYNLTI